VRGKGRDQRGGCAELGRKAGVTGYAILSIQKKPAREPTDGQRKCERGGGGGVGGKLAKTATMVYT